MFLNFTLVRLREVAMNELVQRRFDYDIFLSYSSHDKPSVLRLAKRLRETRHVFG